MTTEKALEVLGLTSMPDAAALSAAFGKAMRANHPDTTGQALANMYDAILAGKDLDAPSTSWTADAIKAARDHLRQVVTGANNACLTCRGRGVIRAKMGTTPCAACKGTGDKRGH